MIYNTSKLTKTFDGKYVLPCCKVKVLATSNGRIICGCNSNTTTNRSKPRIEKGKKQKG